MPAKEASYDQRQIEALRQHMTGLSPVELKAVFLRFWGPCSIEEIARELKTSWDVADRIIDRALSRLRATCKSDLQFRKAVSEAPAA
jgi:DNA-directed RNA polymerase specialized sigma24 family protein